MVLNTTKLKFGTCSLAARDETYNSINPARTDTENFVKVLLLGTILDNIEHATEVCREADS